jgi:predicted phage terminase large subunit-like protein|tara:strand:- start:11555 stop:13018 length:1464 start_codon:yes stop_codon:yes gene_type:complete
MRLDITEETVKDLPSKEVVKIAIAETSLLEFIKQAWHILEPTTEFIYGWHLKAICNHLEAVSRREIKNLIINVPPRHMKSLAVSVFWPCWSWITNPSSRWLFSSYAQELSTRDSLKCRRILQSQWFTSRWGGKFRIKSDQNMKTRFENDKTGYRIATSVSGLVTGEGGDHIICDDPHNVKQAESNIIREGTLRWWDESMSTRMNDPNTGVKVIVMQRLHEGDLTGHILEKNSDYVHLRLPARYEEENKCVTSLGFSDPRTVDGEPLWKEFYGENELSKLENELASEYAIAGQLQQRPSVRGGGLFEVNNFGYVNNVHPTEIIRSVRYWDKGGTEDGAFTGGCLMHKMKNNSFIIEHLVAGLWKATKREEMIKKVAKNDGKKVLIGVEQEPGSGGLESADNTVKNLVGFSVKKDKVTGSKALRAEPYATQVEIGNVYLIKGAWNVDFIKQHELFPMGLRKDFVDCASGAFNMLIGKGRAGVWGGYNKK